ncbi:MAG: TlpA family protein disulfide reductase [Planctomycetaceae bacterium]|nr:TlpA family protein disulfide reductase [Planctomycetaceae bacterium]
MFRTCLDQISPLEKTGLASTSESMFKEYKWEIILIFISVAALGVTLGYLIEQTGPMPRMEDGLEVGKEAPSIKASAWINGTPTISENGQGQVTLVYIWSSHCLPCRFVTPRIVEAYGQYKDRVQFIGLTAEGPDQLEAINEFISENAVEWPTGYGPDAVETIIGFESNLIPEIFIIGPEGKVVWNHNTETSIVDGLELALQNSAKE